MSVSADDTLVFSIMSDLFLFLDVRCIILAAVMDEQRFEAGGFCDVCKMAVRYVDGILEQNATQAEIEVAVLKVCNFLPEAVRDEVRHTCSKWTAILHPSILHVFNRSNAMSCMVTLYFKVSLFHVLAIMTTNLHNYKDKP